MSRQPMVLTEKDFRYVQKSIVEVQRSGRSIRKIFANYYDDDVDINWEVDACKLAERESGLQTAGF